jgi:hypothetical protein
MSDILKKIIAGTISGIVIWFVTQRYIIPSDENKSAVETTTVNSQMVGSNPQAQPANDIKKETQETKVLPSTEITPQKEEEIKSEEKVSSEEKSVPVVSAREAIPVKKKNKTVEEELQPIIHQGRAKGDTLVKDAKIKNELKTVRKKADNLFDELDQEAPKDSIP